MLSCETGEEKENVLIIRKFVGGGYVKWAFAQASKNIYNEWFKYLYVLFPFYSSVVLSSF